MLPADLDAAHRLTYLDLAAARAPEQPQGGGAGPRLRATSAAAASAACEIGLVLEGQYEDIRRFIYGLETAPEFVIIDDMAIDQGRDAQDTLVLTLQLSTYYRMANDAS